MKKIFTLFLSICMCTLVMAQRPEAVIAKAGDVKPVIDGVLDDVWTDVEQHNVTLPYRLEVPTLGEEGETYWKALWDEEGMYIIIVTNDDVWYPYSGTGDAYTYDKIELYFDTNYVLDDGVGGRTGTDGHRQIAPDPDLTQLNGEMKTLTIQDGIVKYAYKVDDPAWTTEWFIPWTAIPDKDGNVFDKQGVMGFDVDITDNDNDGAGRKRAMWANVGAIDENWNNMNDAGHLTFEGAEPSIDITSITISGGQEITMDNGTVQLAAAITPENATQPYKWVISGGTGQATITKDGLVQGVRDGTVLVKAVSADNFTESNELTITVSNQRVTHFESSFIKDGDFTQGTGTAPSPVWTGIALIENGVLTISNPTVGTDPWSFTVGQDIKIPEELKDTPFVLQFTAWADEERTFDVDFELIGDNYERFGDTPDPRSSDGKTQWRMTLTPEPTVYKFEITNFTRMDTRAQKFNFFAGLATPKIYIDSVFLVTAEDYVLKANDLNKSITRVYPNPVGNAKKLYVELSTINSKVAIFNSVGQKLMETKANGYKVSFDVSSLRQGLYFIKTDDGAVQKFIK